MVWRIEGSIRGRKKQNEGGPRKQIHTDLRIRKKGEISGKI